MGGNVSAHIHVFACISKRNWKSKPKVIKAESNEKGEKDGSSISVNVPFSLVLALEPSKTKS